MLAKLLPFVKKGGLIAVVVPGFIGNYDEGNLPKEVEPFWAPDWYFRSCHWWKTLWEKEPGIKITSLREMDCCQKAWDDFMECPMAQEKMVPIMEAGAGHYFNLIEIVGQKNPEHDCFTIFPEQGKTLPVSGLFRVPFFLPLLHPEKIRQGFHRQENLFLLLPSFPANPVLTRFKHIPVKRVLFNAKRPDILAS